MPKDRPWRESACEAYLEPSSTTDEWSTTFTFPMTPSTVAPSPINDLDSVALRTVAPEPTIVSTNVDCSTREPALIETFGPMVESMSVTSSSTYTGSTILTPAGTDVGRRAPPLSSMTRFVPSSVPTSPSSYHPATSTTLSLAPWSIMYWNASVR